MLSHLKTHTQQIQIYFQLSLILIAIIEPVHLMLYIHIGEILLLFLLIHNILSP